MSRSVLQVFEAFQAARTNFTQTVAELASRPQNIETLQNAGVLALLRPLLLDAVPSIQRSAALALGRLANYSEQLAEAVVMNEVLPQLVYSLAEQNREYKKAAAFVLKAVAKHSPELANSVVEAGALNALVGCLMEFEPSVKEAAAWALGYIARHTPELAQAVVDTGAVSHLILCLQEPEISLKRISASTLAEISKHSPDLAQIVVDEGGVTHLVALIQHPDAKLKRQVCACLGHIAKHSVDLAEVVVEAEIFPKMFTLLKDPDQIVCKHAATCIREVSKHSVELANLIVHSGGHGSLIEYCNRSTGANRLPALMALGYIAAFQETLALGVIVGKGIVPLKDALMNGEEDHVKAAAAWSLGQLGRHSSEHARALAQADVLRKLIDAYHNPNSSDDLKTKSERALKSIIQKCTFLPALEPLLHTAPDEILKYIVQQFAKVLPNAPEYRKSFVESKGLQRVQELKEQAELELAEYVAAINACYPDNIVQYYSPNYQDTLMRQLEDSKVQ